MSFNDDLHRYLCLLDRDETYRELLGLGEEWVNAHEGILSQSPVLSLSEATVLEETMVISPGTQINIQATTSPHRRLAPVQGQTSLLAVWATSNAYNEVPQEQEVEKIHGRVFGRGEYREDHTVTSQISACSFDQQVLQPSTGPNIVNGVVDVDLGFQIFGCNIVGQCQGDLRTATMAALGVTSLDTIADMIIFCLPNGSTFGDSRTN